MQPSGAKTIKEKKAVCVCVFLGCTTALVYVTETKKSDVAQFSHCMLLEDKALFFYDSVQAPVSQRGDAKKRIFQVKSRAAHETNVDLKKINPP